MTEDVGEFHFCMEKALMDQVGSVFIDCDPTGSFRIYTERPLSSSPRAAGAVPCKTLPRIFPKREASGLRPFGVDMFLSMRRVSAFI